jgi:hypothetical protein
MYLGKTFYWKKGDGLLITPVHYAEASREVELRFYVMNTEIKKKLGDMKRPIEPSENPFLGIN